MVQLSILSGKQAGSQWVARRFPVHIGRAAKMDLRLDDPGVWDEHLQILLKPKEGYFFQAEKDAMISLNGQALRSGLLRNGDSIEFGASRLQFWLAESGQRGLGVREWLTWVGIALVSLGQVSLVYWLLTL
jgi:hypothetical protein